MACHARREGDEMVCARCSMRWPSTEDAPACKPIEQVVADATPKDWLRERRHASNADVDAQLRRAREFMFQRNAMDLAPLVQLVEHQMRAGPYLKTQELLEIMVAAFLTDRDKVK